MLVSKDLQTLIGLKLVALTLVLTSAIGLILIYSLVSKEPPMFVDNQSERQYLFQTKIMIGSLISLILFGSGAVYAFSIWVMHKIAGPLVPIHRFLDGMLEGKSDMPAIKLRKGDHFQDLAEKLNQLRDKIKPS